MKDLPPEWIDSLLFAQCLGRRCWRMSAFRRNKKLTTAAWHRQTARRVMVWWQMDNFFFLNPHTKRCTNKDRDLNKCTFPFFAGPQAHVSRGWSVTVPLGQGNLCPAFAQCLCCWSLNPSCQDRLNWAAVHLGCFLSDKENHVVWRNFRGWERVKK